MASKTAIKRLTKEYAMIKKSPPEFITAKPLDNNILEWHFIITGPPDTAYEGGQYHGKITFPKEYPFKPPALRFVTPNGRFDTNMDICTSMSNYHPQSWNPSWSVATIAIGLLSMMTSDENTTGAIEMTFAGRKALAEKSHEFNKNCPSFKNAFGNM